jgi:2-dehydropantoate 2-reductase
LIEMRQVPTQTGRPAHHLLVGSGKISRHFAKYFAELGLACEVWKTPRSFSPDFFRNLHATHVWILVSDHAIEEVTSRIRSGLAEFGALPEDEPLFLHASGATQVVGVLGAHPLMTFGANLYDLETYRRIPFVVENRFDGGTASEALGGLPNLAVFLDPEKRALYHSLVSVAGNFPALLWAEVFERFENELGLSRDLLAPFLFRTLGNVISSGDDALTGPLVRGDHATLKSHRVALAGTPLSPIYSAFEEFFQSRGVEHAEFRE